MRMAGEEGSISKSVKGPFTNGQLDEFFRVVCVSIVKREECNELKFVLPPKGSLPIPLCGHGQIYGGGCWGNR